MITEDYASFEIAKLLKEKGFDEKAKSYFTDDGLEGYMFGTGQKSNSELEDCFYSRPTLQMAMKWLREVYNIDVVIDVEVGMLGIKVYVPLISIYKPLKDSSSKVHQIKKRIYYKDDKGVILALQHFDSYEEACETAIKYCLEILI